MAKERIFDLQETKGTFQLVGKVTGCSKEGFYKEGNTDKGKVYRKVSFGVETDEKKTTFLNLFEMPQENVYFSKKVEGGKNETKKVAWDKRTEFKEQGFGLIGMNLGLEKVQAKDSKGVPKVDNNGNPVMENKKMTLVGFDACKVISDKLKDDMSVFIKGDTAFSSYVKGENTTRKIDFVPSQISLCSKDVDFSAEDFEEKALFTQTIVLMSTETEEEDGKKTGRAIVTAKIVNYSTIEEAEFIIDEKHVGLIKTFRTLKPYTGLKVHGIIANSAQVDTVEEDDGWGDSNKMERQQTPYKRELIIMGADKESVDTTTWTKKAVEEAEEKIAKAKRASSDYGETTSESTEESGGWGDTSSDEELPWG